MDSNNTTKRINFVFERFASATTSFAGSSIAFAIAFLIILVWGILGPMFHFSEIWQIWINTGTTIITFLMVFLIQHSQNKDSLSIHLKLNEIISALDKASNRLINSENLSEDELKVLQKLYGDISVSKKEETIQEEDIENKTTNIRKIKTTHVSGKSRNKA